MRELKQNWQDVFSAFRVAFDPKKMLLGFVGVFLSLLWIWVVLQGMSAWYPKGPDIFLRGMLFWTDLSGEGGHALATLSDSVCSHLAAMGFRQVLLMLVAGLPALLIWSFFGGAILRSAAIEFCKDDRIDVGEATAFSRKKLWSFFWAPLVPVIGIVVLWLCIYIGGLVGRIPVIGPLAVGIFFFLALLAGFLIVLMLIGGLFGFPLMGPTIAVEGTDAFDAVSRSFSYVYGRPWRYVWYTLVGLAYGLVCVGFVVVFTLALLKVVFAAGGAGMGKSFDHIAHMLRYFETPGSDASAGLWVSICGWLILLAAVVVWGMVVGFAVSLCHTLATIKYCLLRKDVDGTEVSEVYLEEEEEEFPEEAPTGESQEAAEESAEKGEEKAPAAEASSEAKTEAGEDASSSEEDTSEAGSEETSEE